MSGVRSSHRPPSAGGAAGKWPNLGVAGVRVRPALAAAAGRQRLIAQPLEGRLGKVPAAVGIEFDEPLAVRPAEHGLRARSDRWRGKRSALSQGRAPPPPCAASCALQQPRSRDPDPGKAKAARLVAPMPQGTIRARGRQVETQEKERRGQSTTRGARIGSAQAGELATPAFSAGLAGAHRWPARGKLGHLLGKFGRIYTGVRQRLCNNTRRRGRALLDLLSHD